MISLLLPWPTMCEFPEKCFFSQQEDEREKMMIFKRFLWLLFPPSHVQNRIWPQINQNILPSWFWRGIFVSSHSLVLLRSSHCLKKNPSTFLHIPSHEIFCYVHITLAVDKKIWPASVSSDKECDLVLHNMASRASAELQTTPRALCADFGAQVCDWGI